MTNSIAMATMNLNDSRESFMVGRQNTDTC
jgi:hypothetical protein